MHARIITVEETTPLRSAILRTGRPIEQCHMANDNDPTTFHVGVFADIESVEAANVAIATMMRQDEERCPARPAYRLRGMAVAADHRRAGFGSEALKFAEEEAARRGGVAVWCDARVGAIPFYLSRGYVTVGDEYVIPDVGPHFFCRKLLQESKR